ncbi:MAG: LysM peptidoglycan-binding domain-containing protein [Ardenticatenaceae bacterium]|nr:LysM peptidoglycan-binding domain-containing protein [Ardenticatenaceae bacterium]
MTSSPTPPSGILAEHTVKPGETLSHIALQYYGTAVRAKWMAIYEANREKIGPNYAMIRPGQRLKIPVLLSDAPPSKIIAEYEVVPGDTLSHIALWHYGTAARAQWMKIYEANRPQIGKDPGLIRPGQILQIPDPNDGSWFMRSDKPMQLTFKNQGAMQCDIYWVNFEGIEIWRGSVEMGGNLTLDTYETHQWVARDAGSHMVIAATVAVRRHPTFVIDTDHLRSPRDLGPAISIVAINYTSLAVDLYQVGPTGQETLLHSLNPDDDAGIVQTHVNAVLRVRDHDSQEEVNLFVVSADRRREYMVGGAVFDGNPQTTLEIYNDTGLAVGVYREVEDGHGRSQQKYHRTIGPFQYVYQQTYATHTWVFRDQHSGREVGRAIAAATPNSQTRIIPENLRSAGGSQPVTHLTIHNHIGPWIDIHKVDAKGVRHLIAGGIAPENSYTYDSKMTLFVGDVLLISEQSSGSRVAQYILGADSNEFDVTLKTVTAYPNGTIELYNTAPLQAEIHYFDDEGKAWQAGTLHPGQRAIFPTDASTPWMASSKGLPLGIWFGLEGDHGYQITAHGWRSRSDMPPATVTLLNDTHYDVEAFTLDTEGEAHVVGTAVPNTTLAITATLYTAVRLRDAATGATLLMLVINQDGQVYNLAEHLIVTGEREGGILFPGEIALFSEEDFKGNAWIVRTSFANLAQVQTLGSLNDTVSSIKVGPGTGVTLYEDPSFGGKREDYFVNISALNALDDKVSSLKIWTYAGGGTAGIQATTGIWNRKLSLDLDYQYIVGELSIPEPFQHPEALPGGAISFLADLNAHFRERLQRGSVNWSDLEQVRALVHEVLNWERPLPTLPAWANDPDVLRYIAYWWRIRETNLGQYHTGKEKAKQAAYRVRQNRPLSPDEELMLASELERTCQQIIEQSPTSIPYVPSYHFESQARFYRCIVSFPPEVTQVKITALGETKVSFGGTFTPISATFPYTSTLNATGKLTMLLLADSIGKPVLKLQTNTMADNEAFLVYPDAEIYRNFNQLDKNAMWQAKDEIGVTGSEATCQAVEQALRNVSAAISYAQPDSTQNRVQIDGRHMEYQQWVMRFGDDPRFIPVGQEGYNDTIAKAKLIDATTAQGWDDFVNFWEDVGDAIVDAGEAVVGGIEWVGVQVYDNIIVPATTVAQEVIKKAVEYGQAAVNIVAKFGESALNYIEKMGTTAFNTLMTLGESTWDALMALPDKGLLALADLGTKALNTLIEAGEDVVKFTAQLGKEGLNALKSMGQLGMQLALEIKQGVQNAGQFMADMLSSISPELGKALEMTISIGGEAMKFVINLGQQAGKLVTTVVNKLGVLAGRFIAWIATPFGWDDVLQTQETLTKLVNDALAKAIDFIPDALDTALLASWQQASAQMKRLLDASGIPTPPKPLGIDNMANRMKSELGGMDQFQWLMSQLGDLLPDATAGLSVDDLLDDEAMQAIDELQTLAQDVSLATFNQDLERPLQNILAAQNALTNPHDIPQIILGQLLGPMRAFADQLLDLIERALRLLIKLFRALLRAAQRLINTEIDLPGLNGFIEGLTGEAPTILNMATLLMAIPVTALAGPTTATVPSLALNADNQSLKNMLAGLYGGARIVSGVTGPVADLTEESVKSWAFTNWIVNLIAQVTSQPNIVDDSWEQTAEHAGEFFAVSLNAPGYGDRLGSFIWFMQWGTFGLGTLATVGSFIKKTKGAAEGFNLFLSAITCGIGVFQLVTTIGLVSEGGSDDEKDAADIIGCIPAIVAPATAVDEPDTKALGWTITSLASFVEGGLRMDLANA